MSDDPTREPGMAVTTADDLALIIRILRRIRDNGGYLDITHDRIIIDGGTHQATPTELARLRDLIGPRP